MTVLSWTLTNAESSSPARVTPVVLWASSQMTMSKAPAPSFWAREITSIDWYVDSTTVVTPGTRPRSSSATREAASVVAGVARSGVRMSSLPFPTLRSEQTAKYRNGLVASADHSRSVWLRREIDGTRTVSYTHLTLPTNRE